MKIECVEFYPIELNPERGTIKGTVRVKLIDHGLDILGIYVACEKGNWFVKLPGRFSNHHLTNEKIWFPFISFESSEQQRELIEAIKRETPDFIQRRLEDKENPIVIPPRPQKPQKQPQQAKPQPKEQKCNGGDSTQKKQKPSEAVPVQSVDDSQKKGELPTSNKRSARFASNISERQWADPPPRKTTQKLAYTKLK